VEPCAGESLLAMLAAIPDPRGRKGRRHPLAAMLAAIVCGLLTRRFAPRTTRAVEYSWPSSAGRHSYRFTAEGGRAT